MNKLIHSATSDGAWTRIDTQPPVPNTSLLPGAEKTPAPADDLMSRVLLGAHDGIDRLADGAAPAVRQLSDSVAEAGDALHAKADQLRARRDEWADGLRGTVRNNPLAAVAAAVALGALIVRLTR